MIRAERSAVRWPLMHVVRLGICGAVTPFGRCWRALTRMDIRLRSAKKRLKKVRILRVAEQIGFFKR